MDSPVDIEIIDGPTSQGNSRNRTTADNGAGTSGPPRFSLLNSVAAVFENNNQVRQERSILQRAKRQSELAHSQYLQGMVSPVDRAEARAVVGQWAKINDAVGNSTRSFLKSRRRLANRVDPSGGRPFVQAARPAGNTSTSSGNSRGVGSGARSTTDRPTAAVRTTTEDALGMTVTNRRLNDRLSTIVLSDEDLDEDDELQLALAISLQDMGSTQNEAASGTSGPSPSIPNVLHQANRDYIPLELDNNSNVDLFRVSTSSTHPRTKSAAPRTVPQNTTGNRNVSQNTNRGIPQNTSTEVPHDANRNVPLKPGEIFRCSILNCEAVFTTEVKLAQHHEEFNHSPCNPCLQILDFGLALKPFAYACPKCGKEHETETSTRDHMCKSGHSPFSLPVPICGYLCPQCMVIFRDKPECTQHMTMLSHFDLSYPFSDDLNNPKPQPVAVTPGFVQDFVGRCSKELFSIQCVDCSCTLDKKEGKDHHNKHPSHILSASATSSPTAVIIQYLGFCPCDHCGVLLPPDQYRLGTTHHCLFGHLGKVVDNDSKSFVEFIRRCGMRFLLPKIRSAARSTPLMKRDSSNQLPDSGDSDSSVSPVMAPSNESISDSSAEAISSVSSHSKEKRKRNEETTDRTNGQSDSGKKRPRLMDGDPFRSPCNNPSSPRSCTMRTGNLPAMHRRARNRVTEPTSIDVPMLEDLKISTDVNQLPSFKPNNVASCNKGNSEGQITLPNDAMETTSSTVLTTDRGNTVERSCSNGFSFSAPDFNPDKIPALLSIPLVPPKLTVPVFPCPRGVTRFSAPQPSQFQNPSFSRRRRPLVEPRASQASYSLPMSGPPSTDKLSTMKLVIFLDIDNWPSFFKKLPRCLPDMVFVWGFWGGATVWREPFQIPCFAQQKRKGLFHLNRKCGRTKDAADFALVLQVGKMDALLPKSVAFTILSGDKGFCEVENQLISSERRVVVIDPHKSNRQSQEIFYTSIVSVFDA